MRKRANGLQLLESQKITRDTANHIVILDLIIIGLIILLALIINSRMLRYGVHGLGDIRWHMTWIQHFHAQLAEGILYPRWLAGTNYGYGSPTFVFYPPFAYYIGSFFKAIGLNIEQAITAAITLAISTSGLAFYIYGRSIWGKIPALFGAIAYMASPLVFILIHGGVLAFTFGLTWIPLGLYLTDKASRESAGKVPFFLLVFCWGLFSLVHLPSLLLYTVAWTVYVLFQVKPIKSTFKILLTAPLGWSLAAFYLIPNIFEQKFVSIDYMLVARGGFKNEMLNILEHIGMGFSSAYVLQFVTIMILAGIALLFTQKSTANSKKPGTAYRRDIYQWLGIWIVLILIMSTWTWPIWKLSGTLQKIENTGRLAGLMFFIEASFFALTFNRILSLRSLKRSSIVLKFVCVILVFSFISFDFFKGYKMLQGYPTLHTPGNGFVTNEPWVRSIVENPYSDNLIDVPEYRPFREQYADNLPEKELHSAQGIPETYIPNEKTFLPTPIPNSPYASVIEGDAEITTTLWNSYRRSFEVTAKEKSAISIRTYYYPAWHLTVDQQRHDLMQADDGTLAFVVEPGQHQVELSYRKTPAYIIGLIVSSLSMIFLFGLALKLKRK
ncbi:MAG: hypothetical protein AAFX95_06785 [Cyanobacteria bacterium J06639_16]